MKTVWCTAARGGRGQIGGACAAGDKALRASDAGQEVFNCGGIT